VVVVAESEFRAELTVANGDDGELGLAMAPNVSRRVVLLSREGC
jgi:hypothetical protein